jgi:tetratricopeptide (TPR) repeat protein
MSASMPEKNHTPAILLAGGVIALAGVIAYRNTFTAPFVFDAGSIIAYNPTLRHLGSAWSPPHDGSTVDGRPLLNVSLALNYAFGGAQVGSYHALNLLIHILAGLVLFGLVRRTLAAATGILRLRSAIDAKAETNRWSASPCLFAFAVALLWTLHPLQTAAVTYVVQRAESLMGLCYFLTLYCFLRGAEAATRRGAWGWFGAAWLACLGGMATKEVMVSAPVMVFLYDRTFLGGTFREAWRRRRGAHLALASTWILLAALEFGTAGRNGTAGFAVNLPWSSYLLTQVYAIAHYLRLAFWPRGLVFDYGRAVVTQGSLLIPAALVVALLAGATLVALVRRPVCGFLGFWFFGILAPTSLVPVATQTMAEHRMYLPLAALIVLAVAAVVQLAGRASLPIFLALAAGLGAATVHRNGAYRSEMALWGDTVAKDPRNARAHNNLGNALFLADRIPEAAEEYARALAIQPDDNPEAHYNLGSCFLQEGRLPEAIRELSEAVRVGYGPAHNNLGKALAESGRLDEGRQEFQAALRTDPNDAEAHNNLGAIWTLLGRRTEAIAEYEEALRLKPDFPDARAALDHLRATAP